jgi:predicted RNase H-like HicB family nuclease
MGLQHGIIVRPIHAESIAMHVYTAVIEKCTDTGLYVGYVPGFPGAHSQGETIDELNENLREVVAMLLEEGERRDGQARRTERSV